MKYLVIALCVGTALARPDGAGGHHHDHSAAAAPVPSSGYQEPAAGYSAPASGYEQPAYDSGAGYSAPSAGGYDAGYDTGYTAPESYAPASYGTTDTGPFLGFGLGWVFIPIVIVLGLFLLFPSTTVVPVDGRRKRGAEEGELHKQIHFYHRVSQLTMHDYLLRHPVSYIVFTAPLFKKKL